MIEQAPEYLDHLFVDVVNDLETKGGTMPCTDYIRLKMSALVRQLVLDKQSLLRHAAARCTTPAIVLVPEPLSGNPRYDPNYVLHPAVIPYAPEINDNTFPGGVRGYFNSPYTMEEYLKCTHMVIGRPITPREIIRFLANKMGGVHAEAALKDLNQGGQSVDGERLFRINKHVSIYGEESIFRAFHKIAGRVWACCAPLRDELDRGR